MAKSLAKTQPVPLWLRLCLALVLLPVAAFAAFGFLATFEPNPWWVTWPWRVAYAALAVTSLAGVVKLLGKRRAKLMDSGAGAHPQP